MNFERTPRHPGVISAQQRLAQTRNEIAALILPVPGPAAQQQQAAARRAAARRHAAAEAESMEKAAAAMQQADLEAEHVEYMHAQGMAMPPAPPGYGATAEAGYGSSTAGASAFAWKPLLRRGASIWWRHHPAHAAFEVADSMLSHVARRKPYQMLGVAAAAGALLMLIRPWRLVSITGLAFAALKMTDVRGLFGSLRGD